MTISAALTATLRVFDFGGQPAFHVMHTLLVSDWTAAFVVCVDLSKSHEELKQSLWYWLRFIATRVKQSRETLFASELQDPEGLDKRPRVILVGTKADKCHPSHRLNTEDGSSQRLASCIHSVVSTFSPVLDVLTPECVIPLNCFRSQDDHFLALKATLSQHWDAIKRRRLVVPRVVQRVSAALGKLRRGDGKRTGPLGIDEAFARVREKSEDLTSMGDSFTLDIFRLCLRCEVRVVLEWRGCKSRAFSSLTHSPTRSRPHTSIFHSLPLLLTQVPAPAGRCAVLR